MSSKEWEFKEDAEPQGSSNGFWYDITDGGYVKPSEVLKDEEQLKKVQDAISLLMSLKEAMENAELIIEF